MRDTIAHICICLQIDMYTRVLMGHIDLASLVFPAGTAGCHIDAVARRHLWSAGVDCMHGECLPRSSCPWLSHEGIGHGVGAALNVHEGPQRISRVLSNTQPLQPHMIVSIEPGYYQQDCFGIRLENLYEVVPACERSISPCSHSINSTDFLRFRPLTFAPFQRKLINTNLMSKQHIAWLNEYHRQVLLNLTPVLQDASAAKFVDKYAEVSGEKHLVISSDLAANWVANACQEIAPL